MEQLYDEIVKHNSEFKNKIQCIGDNNNKYNENKNICICVYNSVSIIKPYFESFDKIYIDEAHHIDKPIIYEVDDIDNKKDIKDEDNEDNKEDIKDDDEEKDEDEEEEDEEDEEEDDIEDDEDEDKDEDDEEKDDIEDEIKETTKYSEIIKNLSKYNNNVYLSATIDEIDNFIYYKKDIRDMIEQKYLCDYNIEI
jgi:hypothetical protein